MLKLHRPSLRRTISLAVATTVALLVAAAPAAAVDDRGGVPIPNTEPGSTSELVDGATVDRWLAAPESPDDDDPATVESLCCPGDPETDLFHTLGDLEDAPDAAAAQEAIDRALAILEGEESDTLNGRAYAGIPLLNWDAPLKTKEVVNGDVEVTEVRFGDHVLRDTWLLQFPEGAEDEPFTITYKTAELRNPEGATLAPAPLLADDQGPLGGVHSAVHPLALPRHETGTQTSSRFNPAGGEVTRTAVESVEVRMPPPGDTEAVLEPPIDPRTAGLATLRPATAAEAADAREAAGFAGTTATAGEKEAAIAKLSDESPEKQIWSDLQGIDPEADLDAARAVGELDRPLVAEMRTRSRLPNGVVPRPTADVTVVIQNNETYLGRQTVSPEPGAPIRVQVVNRDESARQVEVLGLSNRRDAFGALDLGTFDHSQLTDATIQANGDSLLTVDAGPASFGLVVGDPEAGDQASAHVAIDRGPRRESLAFKGSSDFPLHGAEDHDGNIWMTVEGTDRIARVTPADDLASSEIEEFDLDFTDAEGRVFGVHELRSTNIPLGPHDISVDTHGVLWATLTLGNAIVRIDPAEVGDAGDPADDGLRFYPLQPCREFLDPEANAECAQEFPAAPNSIPSRAPLQMETHEDGEGNTVVWFVNSGSNEVGALRATPEGDPLDASGNVDTDPGNGFGQRFNCGNSCAPLGIDIDDDGTIWFSEGDANRIGHLIPDQSRPYAASAASLDHYDIPTGTPVIDPLHPAPGVCTSLPHSVEIDPEGRVWYTGEATGRVGYVDPSEAAPSTGPPAPAAACTDDPPAVPGFQEFDPPDNDFQGPPAPADMAVDRAGTIYWADEYGDVIGKLDHEGPSRGFRPIERRSLTDSPLVTSNGDLWFLEAGANLLTRISDVTAGAPRPGPPPVLEVDPSRDTLVGERMREVDSVKVDVVRGGAVVATHTVGVQQGGFSVTRAAWGLNGAGGDPLREGDEVRVARQGQFPTRPLSFDVADITASVQGDGSLAGQALRGGQAVAGAVQVSVQSPVAAEGSAPISPGDVTRPATVGTFRFTAPEPIARDARGDLSWSQGTIAGIFTTTARFGPQDTTPPEAPRISPGAGLFFGPLSASVTGPDDDSRVFYTTDGSNPTAASTPYTGPFTIASTRSVRAVAIDGDDNRSSVTAADFRISSLAEGLETKASMRVRQAARQGIRASFEAPIGARFFEARLMRLRSGPDTLVGTRSGTPTQSPGRHAVSFARKKETKTFAKGRYSIEVRLAPSPGAALRAPASVGVRLR